MNKFISATLAALMAASPLMLSAEIADKAVHEDFAARKKTVKSSDYFKIFNRKDLTPSSVMLWRCYTPICLYLTSPTTPVNFP